MEGRKMKVGRVPLTLRTLKDVNDFVGCAVMSRTWKMPEESFSISALNCMAGRSMVSKPNSVCHDCYALKGRYRMTKQSNAMRLRLELTQTDYFIPIMVFYIIKKETKHFRWFDSGDIQSIKMLDDICEICRQTPGTKHWLPTKEWKLVRKYIEFDGNIIPENLDIRLSALYINGKPPTKLARRLGLNTSTVVSKDIYNKLSFKCPASKQDNKCQSCRACWTKDIKNVPYLYH